MERRTDMLDFREAMWKWFLKRADLYSYNGMEKEKTEEFRKHLEVCGIDYEKSETPTNGTFSQFRDSFHSNDNVEGLVVEDWSCKCRKYSTDLHEESFVYRDGLKLVIDEVIPLAEIVYGVVQMGQGAAQDEEER